VTDLKKTSKKGPGKQGQGAKKASRQAGPVKTGGKTAGAKDRSPFAAALTRSEDALRKSRENLRKAEEIAKLGNWEWNILTNELIWSDGVYRIYGADPARDKPSYDTVVRTVAPECRDRFASAMEHALKHGAPFEGEYRMIGLDGKERYIHTIGGIVRDGEGRPVTMFGVVQDITRRKKVEASLRKAEALYHELVETAQDLIWQCDAEGRYTYLNAAWEGVLGYPVEEMLGRRFTDFQDPEIARRDRELFGRLLQGGMVKGYETVHRTRHGRNAHLVFNAKLVRDGQGNSIGIRGTAYDITERKRSEAVLKTRERQLAESQRIAHIGSWERDMKTGQVFWSDELFRLLGLDPRTAPADFKLFLEMAHPDDRPLLKKAMDETLREKKPFSRDYRFVLKDGATRNIHVQAELVRDDAGDLVILSGTGQDITERKQAEESLRKAEARLSRAQAIAHMGDWVWDIATNRAHWSDELYRIYGFEPRSVAPDYGLVLQRMHRESKEAFLKAVDAALKEDRHFEMDYRFYRNDGTEAVLHTIGQVIRDETGAPLRMVGIVQDITERKKTENDLELFKNLLNRTNEAIFVNDPQTGRFLDVNGRACVSLGYGRAELLKLGVRDIEATLPDDFVWQNHVAMVRRHGSLLLEGLLKRKDGTTFPVETSVSLVALAPREYMIAVVRDITERKRQEQALAESEANYRNLFESSTDGIFLLDLDGNFVDANRTAYERLGYTREEFLSLHISTLDHPGFAAKVPERLRKIREQGVAVFESGHVRKDGSLMPVEVNARLLEHKGKQVCFSVIRDITERKRTEEEKDRLAKAVSIVTEGIAVTDEKDRFIYLNDAHAKTYGYLQSELMGKTWRDVTPRELVPLIEQEFARTVYSRDNGVWSGEAPGVRKDGTGIATEVTATARWNENGEYLGHICIVRDVTERKRAEEKLRQSEAFVREILDTVDEGFLVMDRDYRILAANKAYCGRIPLSCDEVIGRHCYEISHRTSRPCYEDGEECAVREVFRTGVPHAASHKHHDADGQILFLEMKAYPVKDASGNVTSVIETINNITERHLLEEERLKIQKLESIGTLAGGIAHDFNNLLQGVFGYISMARLTYDQKERSLAMLGQAEKALHQSVSLTSQLLTFSKGGKPLKKAVSLRPVIEDAVKFALSGSRVDYALALADDLRVVEADAGQLGQVIQNIVLNADQAMPLGGTVEITARNIAAPGDGAPLYLTSGKYVEIAVRDTGVGIAEQHLARIFDPYFTTKEKGSGLGLATSYSIIKNHGGVIDVRSNVGKGTTFLLYLPASSAAPAAPAPAAAPAAGRRGRILIMDDEEIVRTITGRLIEALGHDVEFSQTGEEALQKYQSALHAGAPFDAVILDLTVRGGMGGEEAMRKLLEIDPAVKAVMSSGYSDGAIAAEYREHGFSAFLKKPYTIDELQAALVSLLAQGPERAGKEAGAP